MRIHQGRSSCTLQMPGSELSWVFDYQIRQSDLAIGNVVVDMLGQDTLTGLKYFQASIVRFFVNSAMMWSRSAFVSESVAWVI